MGTDGLPRPFGMRMLLDASEVGWGGQTLGDVVYRAWFNYVPTGLVCAEGPLHIVDELISFSPKRFRTDQEGITPIGVRYVTGPMVEQRIVTTGFNPHCSEIW